MKFIIIFILLFALLMMSATGAVLEDLPGWKHLSEPVTYDSENLWEYINGAADLFLSYGFSELEAHEFTNGSLSFSLDIYDMETPINAFGVYMAERAKDASTVRIGTEAVILLPSQCLYLKDRYYVKLYAFEGKLSPETAKEILQKLDKKVQGAAEYPPEFKNLPAEIQLPGTYRFVKESYLGLGILTNCIIAGYADENGKSYEMFSPLHTNPAEAKAFIEKLSESWKTGTTAAGTIYFRKVPYKGYVGLLYKKDQFIGISGLEDLALLKEKLRVIAAN